VPQSEAKLVVVLVWKAVADTMELQWRHQGVIGEAFAAVPGGAINIHPRPSHGLAVVDLTAGTPNATGTEWRVRYNDSSTAAAFDPINVGQILAARDLRVRTEIVFDRTGYRTGQPMKIEARIGAGGRPISNAQVVVELAAPGESLGTFLSVNSQQFQITTIPGTTPVGTVPAGDPQRPKQVLLSQLLRLRGLEELPTVRPTRFFVDGTDRLWDDGTHGDGAANDGRYANTYTRTDKEGTYTFRFHISGQTPDGSRFADTLTVSRWVGVNVDPLSSLIVINALPARDARFQVAQVVVTPRDRGGQFLGPFRASEVKFAATKAMFQGDTVISPDGRYSRELIYPRGKFPIVTVSVQGKLLPRIPVCSGHLGTIVRLVYSWLQWLRRHMFHRS
jgi:hypothetical protein